MHSSNNNPDSIFKNLQNSQIYCPDDPEKVYQNFNEVGRGSFGIVYCAQSVENSNFFAIKKISYSGKQSNEKCQEIVKEVEFMSKLNHTHCVNFKAFHTKDSFAWIVMDYCLGSALDIIDALKTSLLEIEIALILKDSLKGLRFIHSLNKIHRDIKAANILITSQGVIKLGDFGSVSFKSPANSFIGTPFWMAPELILAMEDGDYDCKVDIWSLGITVIELVDTKPPLFHMNAMSALYHISQNNPPKPSNTKLSSDLNDFISKALTKDPAVRPSSDQLMMHKFMCFEFEDRSVIINLLSRVTDIVAKKDNRLTEKIKNLVIDDSDSNETCCESKLSQRSDTESIDLDVPSIESKCSSEEINSDNDCDITSIALSSVLKNDIRRGTLNRNFQTIKSVYNLAHRQSESCSIDIKAYRNARRENQLQLTARKQKNLLELNELKKIHEKIYESLLQTNEKELEKLRFKHRNEMEALQKNRILEEKKLIKNSHILHEHRIKELENELSYNYKEQKKQLIKNFNGDNKNSLVLNLRENFVKLRAEKEKSMAIDFKQKQEAELNDYYVNSKINDQNTEYLLLLEELNILNVHLESINVLILKQYDQVSNIELEHLKNLNILRRDQLNKLHIIEKQEQQNHSKNLEIKLKKQHIIDNKNKPKEIKNIKKKVRKMYEDSIKVQTHQYKMLLKQKLSKSFKEDHSKIREEIDNERRKKLAELTAKFEMNVVDINTKETSKMSEAHKQEKLELENCAKSEHEDLMNNQLNQLASLDNHITLQMSKLVDRIKSDRNQLENKLSESLEIFKSYKNERLNSIKNQKNVLSNKDTLVSTNPDILRYSIEETDLPYSGEVIK